MIDFNKRGLRLGYLLRGALHDSGGTARTLRLSGPSSRVGSGHVAADPDDSATAAQARRRYWRAGVSGVSLVDDAGKLQQHIGIPGQLSITVPISYPLDPRTETADDTDDATLREWALSGRWANRRVDVWLVDLDTGDTQHRFRGTWDRQPENKPGSFSLRAREWIGPLGVPWKMTQMPTTVDGYSEATTLSSGGMLRNPQASLGGLGFFLPPDVERVRVGCVFGYNDGAVVNTAPAPVWRQIVQYGDAVGTGPSAPALGDTTKKALWFHVSPQYGCGVGVVRLVGDDGAVYESITADIGNAITGHNYDPDRGPLGTFCVVQISAALDANFTPSTNSNRAYARIHGPSDDPTTVEWHATAGEPFTTLSGGGSAISVDDAPRQIELIIEGQDYLGATDILGTTAIADFLAGNPSSVAEWPEYLCAVPVEVKRDTEISYRDVLSALVAGLPADLLWRYDSTVGERRLYPWWRRPTLAEDPDYAIGPEALVYLAPMPSITQSDDPGGEYANDLTVLAPEFIKQPAALPIADAGLLEDRARNSQRILDPAEQGATKAAAVVAADRAWRWWSPHSAATGNEHSRYLAGELSQPQTWTEAELGARWYKLELGDTVAYRIHGITDAVGMVRRLEYDLEAQTVTVSAIHVVFYETDGGGD